MKTTNMTTKNTISKGFTLVELMVVIAIIAVLATVGLTLFQNSQRTARNSRVDSDLQAISQALETHYLATGGVCDSTHPIAGAGYCGLMPTWFASGAIPTPPSTGQYCGHVGNLTMAGLATGACNNAVGAWAVITTTAAAGTGVPGDAPAGGWSICASLEPYVAAGTVHCVHNQQL